MKFQSITMKNFMRYKGVNTITFSCDDAKNVTVVLGDNTVGKTTIAQAFRWCLYGALMVEGRKKQEDYQILNNDVLLLMDANARASASVDLVFENDTRRYHVHREEAYTRDFPRLIARVAQKKLKMWISEKDSKEDEAEVEESKVAELINELFPQNLSHYFLFDGERWNDVTVNGVRENIKESVHILTGLSAYQAAMRHLKEMGGNSVIRQFEKKIKGGGKIYDDLEADRNRMEHEIEKCSQQMKSIDVNIANYENKCREIEQYLEENKNTEVLQAKYRQYQTVKSSQYDRVIANYKLFVNEVSDKAYMLFARNMITASLAMVKTVAGERRDIPHMHQASIDYIIRSGTCICGTPILPDSKEFACLLEQRNFLPPADIGSLLGEFERRGDRWQNRVRDTREELAELAQKVDDALRDYEETSNQLSVLEQKMDERVDFAEKRRLLRNYRDEIRKLSGQRGNYEGKIESYRKQIELKENEMRSQEQQSAENKKWRGRLELAELLYKKMKQDFSVKEQKIFQELNEQIQDNFARMFNAKDKKVMLTPQYEIQMLYQTDVGFREEKNLSEGEKIARNFAFIVTLMDYSRQKKAERMGLEDYESDTLPLVLDGPFSKLGDENISLISQVLPSAAEQVIIFMLRKDWKYTGLDDYVGAAYEICKRPDQSYASIQRKE